MCLQVFQDAGLTNPVLSSIGVGTVFVFGTGLAAAVMDHVGRRPLLLWSHIAMAACLLVTAAAQTLSGAVLYVLPGPLKMHIALLLPLSLLVSSPLASFTQPAG